MKPVAVVTGAGSGIGRSCALAFFRNGYSVVLAGRQPSHLNQTLSDAGPGATGLAVPTDVCDPAAVHQLFEHTRGAFGRVDVLFNNAGISGPPCAFDAITWDQWQAVVST